MGYVKLSKAAIAGVSQFDLLYADTIVAIKLDTSSTPDSIKVSYLGGAVHEAVIVPVADLVQADVQALNEAVGLIGGGSGMIDVMLSQKVSEVTFS